MTKLKQHISEMKRLSKILKVHTHSELLKCKEMMNAITRKS